MGSLLAKLIESTDKSPSIYIIQILKMSQTPEHQVLHRNRLNLEDYVKDHMTRIAREFEASNILTPEQYDDVTSDSKQGARILVGILLRTVRDEDDSETFTYFLNVIRRVGNNGFQKLAQKIEDARMELYRGLFPDVSGKDCMYVQMVLGQATRFIQYFSLAAT